MNKTIIFDLDGVLVDSKEIHYESLNFALKTLSEKYVISKRDQSDIFEGMTTRAKLDILTHTKGLPKELHQYIWSLKQQYSSTIFKNLPKDNDLIDLFKYINDCNILIGVASNSIRQTLANCLESLGVSQYVKISLSNEDVKNPKPNPEIYNLCMLALGSTPSSTIIFEDSDIGRAAAKQSGAFVVEVESRKDLTIKLISDMIGNYFG